MENSEQDRLDEGIVTGLILDDKGVLQPCKYTPGVVEADYGLWWIVQNVGGCVIFQRFPHANRPLDEPPLLEMDGPYRINLKGTPAKAHVAQDQVDKP